MRNLFAAGSFFVGFALLSAACGVENQTESNGVEDPTESSSAHDALSIPSGEAVSCVSIQDWVEQNRSKLPTDYDELGRLPWAYRRVVLGELPPATRSALFQTHYERYALAHPDMSPAQRAVLDRAKELMTPDVYALPRESPEWKTRIGAPQAELERQARAAFDPDEVVQIFSTIGSEDPATVHLPPATAKAATEYCNCSTASDFCSSGYTCRYGVITCIYTSTFCGWNLLYSCNGMCIGK